MSGHSKWATIHRKKGLIDAERGKIFQKIAKEIMVATRGTNGDIETNASLRAVVEKARSNNMPKDNIQKAIDKAIGAGGDVNFESIRYECYGPNGVAIIVDCLTDNRNRTAGDVRSKFTKRGGNLGTAGSVSYMFERKGIITIPSDYDEESMMMTSLDAGADDFETEDDVYVITTTPENFVKVKEALENAGVLEFLTSEVTFTPNNTVELTDSEQIEKVHALIEALEELDDVQDVYCNLKED